MGCMECIVNLSVSYKKKGKSFFLFLKNKIKNKNTEEFGIYYTLHTLYTLNSKTSKIMGFKKIIQAPRLFFLQKRVKRPVYSKVYSKSLYTNTL
jgi:hypothetical protein